MRTNIKGFIAKVLVLCMVLAMLPVSALAVDSNVAWKQDSANNAYYVISEDTTIGAYTIGNDADSIYYIYADTDGRTLTLDGTTVKCTLYIGYNGNGDVDTHTMTLNVNNVKLNGGLSISPNVTISNLSFDYSGSSGIALMSALQKINEGTVILDKNLVTGDIEIPEGVTLEVKGDITIPAGHKLAIEGGTLKVDDSVTVTIESGAELEIAADSTVGVDGKILIEEGGISDIADGVTNEGSGSIEDNNTYYTVKAETNGNGTVSIAYAIGNDVDVTKTACEVAADTEVTITVKANPGYKIDSAYYTIGDDTERQYFTGGSDNERTAAVTLTDDLTVYAVFAPQTITPGPSYSGGGTVSGATVNTSSTKNGSFTVSDKNAKAGDTVTVTPKPDKGFVVDNVVVKDKNGDSVTVTKNADGTYSFEMPEAKLQPVTVEVTFREETIADIYTDVAVDAWYADAVKYCYDNGLMDGIGGDEFAPNAVTTRAMVVTVLYRMKGEPEITEKSDFTDVADGQWYTEAVAWAEANDIVNGYGNGTFGPNDPMTREQMAAVVYRYAVAEKLVTDEPAADLSGYTDAAEIDSWAETAMEWVNAEEIITGVTTTTLEPAGSTTRAQLATVLMRYCENVAK